MNVKSTIVGAVAGSVLTLAASVAGTAVAGETANHEVPRWMTRTCQAEDSVNCYWDGGSHKPHQGEAYIRQVPGTGKVCVFFVNRPRKDYCR